MKQRISGWLKRWLAPDAIGLRAELPQLKAERRTIKLRDELAELKAKHHAALAHLKSEWNDRIVRLKERYRAELIATRRDEAARHERVLVYSLEKTGTVTVCSSLKERVICPVYHLHHMSPETMQDFDRMAEQGDERVRQKLPHWRAKLEGLRDFRGKNRIVTLVRDPIARIVSLAFHILADLRPQWDVTTILPTSQEILECIREVARWACHQTVHWFERELKATTGIDVFATPFPHDVGHRIYLERQADVLLVRLEDLQRCHQAAFREFLGLEDLELKSANIGAEKVYKEAYRQFKCNPCLPDSFLEQMYSTRYARHFYTADEIDQFRKIWRAPRG